MSNKRASNKRFERSFFQRDSPALAPEILGAYLHRKIDGIELIGKIVEVEAYAVGDAAAHTFRGITPRTKVLFGVAGVAYIYFTYGMHYCFNVSANEEGVGEAVLLRAVEPVQGIEKMRTLRKRVVNDHELTSGPARLCQAMALTKEQNGTDLIESDEIFLTRGEHVPDSEIAISTRIGITVAMEHPWRFYVRGNPYVSRGKPSGGF